MFLQKIIFWVLTPCKTMVRRMLQHPPETRSIMLKTEVASFFETLEGIVILNGVQTNKKRHLRQIFLKLSRAGDCGVPAAKSRAGYEGSNRNTPLGRPDKHRGRRFEKCKNLDDFDLWLREGRLLTFISNSIFIDLSNSYPDHRRRFKLSPKIITKLYNKVGTNR